MAIIYEEFAKSQIAFIDSFKDFSRKENFLYLGQRDIDFESVIFHNPKVVKDTTIVLPGLDWIEKIHKFTINGFNKFAILPTLSLKSAKRTCIVSYDKKMIFLPNYKVMYSSFREYMRSNFSEFYDAPKVSHGLNSTIDLSDPQFSDFFKFSIVRNPFDRYASFYRDKLARGENHYNYKIWNYSLNSILGNNKITLQESLEFINRVPDSHSDPHFISQKSKLYHNGKPLVNYIGKIEDLNNSLEYIAEKANISAIKIYKHNETKPAKENVMDFYKSNDESIKIIKERYQSDFQLFNY